MNNGSAILSHGVERFMSVAWHAAAPRRSISVSEWADQHRVVTSKQSGEPGRWRTSRTPFLKEIMDCLSISSRVHDIVVMKSSQVGVSEAMVNFLGYVIDHAPNTTMVLMPTESSRNAWKAQKLNPLLLETPVIRGILGGIRSRDAANTMEMIDFPGGTLFLASGNSPNSYRQRSVRYMLMDDLDGFPSVAGFEGDVVSLARGRTKAFARAKRMYVSTPTVAGASLIEREYLKSDRRRYNVPCPHCNHYQALRWPMLKFNEQLTAAWYVCEECGAEIYEHHKPAMLAAGRWIAENPSSKIRGYHISALYAPIGLGPSWIDLATEWQGAVRSPDTLQTFINTHLGEVWDEQGDKIEPTGLLARLEEYPDNFKALARTAGVDVQKDRLEITIDDWTEGEECWRQAHIILPGDTAQPHVWKLLADEFDAWRPDAVAIDSGFNTSMVYAFVEKRRFCFAVKGVPGAFKPLVEDAKARNQRLRRQRKKGITVHLVGVDQAKALLFARLKITQPGPGYIHFPNSSDFDDEYFAQLTAEKLVTKMRGTRPVAEWVQSRPRNEALDCSNYSLAALRLSGISLDTRAAALKMTPEQKAEPRIRRKNSSNFVKGWK